MIPQTAPWPSRVASARVSIAGAEPLSATTLPATPPPCVLVHARLAEGRDAASQKPQCPREFRARIAPGCAPCLDFRRDPVNTTRSFRWPPSPDRVAVATLPGGRRVLGARPEDPEHRPEWSEPVSVSVVPGMGHAGKRHRGRVALVRNAILQGRDKMGEAETSPTSLLMQ